MRARDRGRDVGLEDVAARAGVHRAVVRAAGLAGAALLGPFVDGLGARRRVPAAQDALAVEGL
jgi:hypothetical protein